MSVSIDPWADVRERFAQLRMPPHVTQSQISISLLALHETGRDIERLLAGIHALEARLEVMEELKEAVEAFKADDTWKFDPAHIGRGLMTWGEVLTALAAAQQEEQVGP